MTGVYELHAGAALPDAESSAALVKYAATVPQRVAAVRDVQAVEVAAVKHAIHDLKPMYPNFHKYHPSAWDKAERDMLIMASALAKAMLLDDCTHLDDQVLTWARTMFKSLNFTPKFMRDTYTLLREAMRRHLKPPSFVLMQPFFDYTIARLSDIPEPARPEV